MRPTDLQYRPINEKTADLVYMPEVTRDGSPLFTAIANNLKPEKKIRSIRDLKQSKQYSVINSNVAMSHGSRNG